MPAEPGSRLLAICFAALLEWDRRIRQRRHLRELDDRALADLGLARADIAREVEKRFWQP
jgi:uncharacterized protein YjiS (DUF1127 family)